MSSKDDSQRTCVVSPKIKMRRLLALSPQNLRSRADFSVQSEEFDIFANVSDFNRSQNPLPELITHPAYIVVIILLLASAFFPSRSSLWLANNTTNTHLSPPPRRPLTQLRHLSPLPYTSALPPLLPLIPLIIVRLPFALQYPTDVLRRDFKLARKRFGRVRSRV
jgi:hypothetical protein